VIKIWHQNLYVNPNDFELSLGIISGAISMIGITSKDELFLAQLAISKSTNHPSNKKPRYLAGLDVINLKKFK